MCGNHYPGIIMPIQFFIFSSPVPPQIGTCAFKIVLKFDKKAEPVSQWFIPNVFHDFIFSLFNIIAGCMRRLCLYGQKIIISAASVNNDIRINILPWNAFYVIRFRCVTIILTIYIPSRKNLLQIHPQAKGHGALMHPFLKQIKVIQVKAPKRHHHAVSDFLKRRIAHSIFSCFGFSRIAHFSPSSCFAIRFTALSKSLSRRRISSAR